MFDAFCKVALLMAIARAWSWKHMGLVKHDQDREKSHWDGLEYPVWGMQQGLAIVEQECLQMSRRMPTDYEIVAVPDAVGRFFGNPWLTLIFPCSSCFPPDSAHCPVLNSCTE